MSDGPFYMYANIICSLVMMICGSWLLTDRRLGRLLRACHACIVAGALVNLLGMFADRLGFHGVSYGHVWPGEVATNAGIAVIMATRVWQSLRDTTAEKAETS